MNYLQKKTKRDRGFTLIELLLVMSIIAVLASLSLVVIGDAQQDARRNMTLSRINQINGLLQQRLENYQVRRIPVDELSLFIDYTAGNNGGNVGDPRQDERDLRRRIINDVINVEMPRSLLNIAFQQGQSGSSLDATYPSKQFINWVDNHGDIITPFGSLPIVEVLAEQPPAFATRFIQYDVGGMPVDPRSMPAAYPEGKPVESQSDLERRRSNSEYLYLILQATQVNGIQGSSSLGDRAFADTDNDGFIEVVDSWGDPISFGFIPNLNSSLRANEFQILITSLGNGPVNGDNVISNTNQF